jgi:hypothetical protein
MGPSDIRVDPFTKNTLTAEDAEDAEENKTDGEMDSSIVCNPLMYAFGVVHAYHIRRFQFCFLCVLGVLRGERFSSPTSRLTASMHRKI